MVTVTRINNLNTNTDTQNDTNHGSNNHNNDSQSIYVCIHRGVLHLVSGTAALGEDTDIDTDINYDKEFRGMGADTGQRSC